MLEIRTMREYRTGYFAAPCRTDRLRKLSYVHGRVNVRVPLGSALANEEMLRPLSKLPAHAACLRRVRGVDIHHGQSSTFGFVGRKVLQLSKSPAMQPRPDSPPGLDVGPDICQVFHSDFTGTRTNGFCNDEAQWRCLDLP